MTDAPLPDEVAQTYLDGSYLSRNPEWHEQDAAWKATQILALLADYHIRPRSICDVGCGTGGILRQLQLAFPASLTYGYDPGFAPVADAIQSTCGPVVGDRRPDLVRDDWDLLLMIDVFEHVQDYMGLLRSYSSTATYAIFHIPLDLSVQTVLRGTPLLAARDAVGHLHYFTRETALATLASCGYHILAERFTRSSIDAPATRWQQRLASVPRRAAFAVNPRLAARLLGGFSLLVLAEPA